MQPSDIIKLAEQARLAFASEEFPDIWQTHMNPGRAEIEAFARLVWAEAQQTAVPQWVACSERLPDRDGMLVAIYDTDAMLSPVWPAKWDAENQAFSAGGGWFEKDEPTHWMPLPPPPETQE